jgi:4-carboxymuconolactone decarboxylase
MSHIAVSEHLDGKSVEWMEKVSDAQYATPTTARAATHDDHRRPPHTPTAGPGVGPDGQPTTAQRLFGDISPKMVELTDGVLFGDIWERPELSKRDRSLVTVSALIAMNDVQLRVQTAAHIDDRLSPEPSA